MLSAGLKLSLFFVSSSPKHIDDHSNFWSGCEEGHDIWVYELGELLEEKSFYFYVFSQKTLQLNQGHN